jgi:hypothetical protein
MNAETDRVLAVKNQYENELMDKPNVVGVGIGFRKVGGIQTNTLSLVVMVTQKIPQSQLDPTDQIPAVIEGVPVDVQEVGNIIAL